MLLSFSINAEELYQLDKNIYEKCMAEQGCRLDSYIKEKTDCKRWDYSRSDCIDRVQNRYDECKSNCLYIYGNRIQ